MKTKFIPEDLQDLEESSDFELEKDKSEHRGRKLSNVDRSINWVDRGVTTPVKHQGNCGSCTLFTGTTILESMYSIKH